MAEQVRVGVFGGTGLYQMEGLSNVREVELTTPFGDPSDAITIGELDGTAIAFLPRHGRGHRLTPTEIPVKANVYAMKELGVERLISVSAVGSLREDIAPLDLVVPDQLIDRTRLRENTFFGRGLVAHVAMGAPFCPQLSALVASAADDTGATVHRGGTYVVMEGPAFSTRAESELYRSWGASVIGMTALPEAKLAREAEMCFTVLATSTDYDVWHEAHADVTVGVILENLQKNVGVSRQVLHGLVSKLRVPRHCDCGSALASALVTAPGLVPKETLEWLGPIVSKYR
ncbi:MAG: S-methyl-5'-thioadenosine phosphorylase [Chloroflexi bacterium]|nr:S-methyl-5'-thioadenosine phosphorylase [Chloroflexota bacterium]